MLDEGDALQQSAERAAGARAERLKEQAKEGAEKLKEQAAQLTSPGEASRLLGQTLKPLGAKLGMGKAAGYAKVAASNYFDDSDGDDDAPMAENVESIVVTDNQALIDSIAAERKRELDRLRARQREQSAAASRAAAQPPLAAAPLQQQEEEAARPADPRAASQAASSHARDSASATEEMEERARRLREEFGSEQVKAACARLKQLNGIATNGAEPSAQPPESCRCGLCGTGCAPCTVQ